MSYPCPLCGDIVTTRDPRQQFDHLARDMACLARRCDREEFTTPNEYMLHRQVVEFERVIAIQMGLTEDMRHEFEDKINTAKENAQYVESSDTLRAENEKLRQEKKDLLDDINELKNEKAGLESQSGELELGIQRKRKTLEHGLDKEACVAYRKRQIQPQTEKIQIAGLPWLEVDRDFLAKWVRALPDFVEIVYYTPPEAPLRGSSRAPLSIRSQSSCPSDDGTVYTVIAPATRQTTSNGTRNVRRWLERMQIVNLPSTPEDSAEESDEDSCVEISARPLKRQRSASVYLRRNRV